MIERSVSYGLRATSGSSDFRARREQDRPRNIETADREDLALIYCTRLGGQPLVKNHTFYVKARIDIQD